MGVGHLHIVDHDVVERTNLHRQHIYGVDDVGHPKVEAATKRLHNLNPYINVEPLSIVVNEENAEAIVEGMDVVVDGLDSMAARYAINRACVKLGVPYVFGAAIATTGNVSTIGPKETACLECFYGNVDDKKLPKHEAVGVHPSLVNVVASLEVSEAVRILTGKKPLLLNKLLHVDLDVMEFREVNISKVESCPVCGTDTLGLEK
jgi:adenylyltransferase/sulfurtransferase